MAEWDKGVLRVNEGNVLGNPLLEIPEPRLRETGILTVEQLRAFELRLHKYIGMQVAESAKLLTERMRAGDGTLQEQADRLATDAAERGLDLVTRLLAVDQQAHARTVNTDLRMLDGFLEQAKQLRDVHVEVSQRQEAIFTALKIQAAAERIVSDERHAILLLQLDDFKRDVENRTTLGRLRRLWAWMGSLVRRVRYGR